MVKGVSRQVIVVHAPEEKLFEQAIFILNENAVGQEGVTDEVLLKEAKRLLGGKSSQKRRLSLYGPVWACGGALLTAIAWLLTVLL